MTIKTFEEIVAAVVAQMARPGIEGWGLNNPDEDIFDLMEIGEAGGCTSSTCGHMSHDPASPNFRLVLKVGQVVSLGADYLAPETDYSYYAVLIDGQEPRFFLRTDPAHYWATLRQIEADSIPAWMLAQFGKAQEEPVGQ